jgi:hypothetical protein
MFHSLTSYFFVRSFSSLSNFVVRNLLVLLLLQRQRPKYGLCKLKHSRRLNAMKLPHATSRIRDLQPPDANLGNALISLAAIEF